MHLTIELMEAHVRDIYRALTGGELRGDGPTAPAEDEVSVDEVARRFIDLEYGVRQISTIGERVPPFSFSPLLDVIDCDDHIVLELAAPGVGREDVEVACSGEFVTITGVRSGERGSGGHLYLHAEIPHGPFHRVVRIPTAFVAEPRMQVERGMIRVYLPKARETESERVDNETKSSAPQFDVQQAGE
jgi:HSP20 family protein